MAIEAMKQALEALTHKKWFRIGLREENDPKVEAAIAALDAAIEAAEKQEPTVCLPRPVWDAVLRVNEFAETHVCTTSPAAQTAPVAAIQIDLAWAVSELEELDDSTAQVVVNVLKKHLCTPPPAAQRQWVELTGNEREQIYQEAYPDALASAITAVENKLKEKNT